MEDKKVLDEIIEEYGEDTIDDLYEYICLKASGFNDEVAYDLIPLLEDLYLTDENDLCISQLSDRLYYLCEDEEEDFLDKLSTREILLKMYEI